MSTITKLLFTHKLPIKKKKVHKKKGEEKKQKEIQENIHRKNYKEVLP